MATLSKAGLARSIVLPVLISSVIFFAPANARSDSAPKAFGGKQADHTSAVSEIQSVLRMQQNAWNQGDIDRFMTGTHIRKIRSYFRRHGKTRMGDGARPLSRKIFRSHEDGTPHFFRSRDRLAVARFGSGAWTLEITAGKGPAARAIYAHLPASAGRVADCARSYVGGSAAEVNRYKR
jgi:hypothetical protein